MTTDLRGPVNPLLPLRPPKPTPDCVICADLDRKRAWAAAAGDHSGVSDCNVRMRRHTHRTAPISR